jgi:hypothetical protein
MYVSRYNSVIHVYISVYYTEIHTCITLLYYTEIHTGITLLYRDTYMYNTYTEMHTCITLNTEELYMYVSLYNSVIHVCISV